MADEMIGHIKRVHSGITVSSEHLALELIQEKGPGGNFLDAPHTVKHLRDEIHITDFFDRQTYQAWEEAGRQTIKDRAREKTLWILENHQPEPLQKEIADKIASIVAGLDNKRKEKFGLHIHGHEH